MSIFNIDVPITIHRRYRVEADSLEKAQEMEDGNPTLTFIGDEAPTSLDEEWDEAIYSIYSE